MSVMASMKRTANIRAMVFKCKDWSALAIIISIMAILSATNTNEKEIAFAILSNIKLASNRYQCQLIAISNC